MNKKASRTEWSQFYDSLAQKGSDELFATARCSLNSKRVVKHIINDIAGKLNLNLQDTLLDLGCGTGVISIGLGDKVSNSVGLDFGRDVLLRAKRNFEANKRYLEPVQGDITALPFKEGTFSKVLCYSVVMYLQNYEEFKEALLEMVRVCCPGGLVMVGDIPEKNKKELWIKDSRREGESLWHYQARRLRQKIIQWRYQASISRFDRKRSQLNITLPQTSGMSYDADTILRICEEIGVRGRILDQPGSLAFGHTRVDLLVEKQEKGRE